MTVTTTRLSDQEYELYRRYMAAGERRLTGTNIPDRAVMFAADYNVYGSTLYEDDKDDNNYRHLVGWARNEQESLVTISTDLTHRIIADLKWSLTGDVRAKGVIGAFCEAYGVTLHRLLDELPHLPVELTLIEDWLTVDDGTNALYEPLVDPVTGRGFRYVVEQRQYPGPWRRDDGLYPASMCRET